MFQSHKPQVLLKYHQNQYERGIIRFTVRNHRPAKSATDTMDQKWQFPTKYVTACEVKLEIVNRVTLINETEERLQDHKEGNLLSK
jgi:hypothetical protein